MREGIKFGGRLRIASTRLRSWDYGSSGWYFITIVTEKRRRYFGDIVDGQMRLSPPGVIAQKYWLQIPNHFQNATLDEYIIMPDHMHGIIRLWRDFAPNYGTQRLMPASVETRQCLVSTKTGIKQNIQTTREQRDCDVSTKTGVKQNVETIRGQRDCIVLTKTGIDQNVEIARKQRDCVDSTKTGINRNVDENRIIDYAAIRYRNPGRQNIPTIVGSYKSICTKTINRQFLGVGFSWQARYYDRIIRSHRDLNGTRDYIRANPQNWRKPS